MFKGWFYQIKKIKGYRIAHTPFHFVLNQTFSENSLVLFSRQLYVKHLFSFTHTVSGVRNIIILIIMDYNYPNILLAFRPFFFIKKTNFGHKFILMKSIFRFNNEKSYSEFFLISWTLKKHHLCKKNRNLNENCCR